MFRISYRKYLIVIDDVWARSTWDIVNRAFPDGNHCSRILVTSELEDVALKCCGYEPQYVHKMKPLSEDDSRQLFYSIVGFSQELSEVSNSIIRKFGGLPLAIVTIASLLASRMGKPEQMEYVHKSLGYGLMTNHTLDGMKQVVNLSYRNLLQHLKACLLYLCIFPEDYIIWTDDLVKQWIAEGFICASEDKDEEEISRSYFDELISSRLIHPIHIDGNGKVLSCTMHPMMRNHIMHESLVENFVAAIDNSQIATRFTHKVRRLSLQFGNAEDATLSTNMRLSQVRTLAFFGAFMCVPSITEFRLLQVLILHFWGEEESIRFDLTSILEIFRLRYLQVTCNVTLEIQEMQMLGRLQCLETLNVDAARGSTVPSDIFHLPRLLHLKLPAETNLLCGIGHMTSLRTLGHFDLSTNTTKEVQKLGRLTNVQDLQLTCTPVGPCSYLVQKMECLSLVLRKLNNLKCLTLKSSRVLNLGRQRSGTSICCDALSSLTSPPALLRRLEWLPRICTFSNLPVWIGHLGKLCILKIGVRELVRNDVDLLKRLPALTVLSLYVHTKPAGIIVFSKGGFLVLKYFRFRCSVTCLKFEADVMPNLRKLKLGFDADGAIQYVPIPAGLHHLSGLEEISAKIGGAGTNEPVRRIVESALSDAIRMHPRRPSVRIQCVDQMFGKKGDENIMLQGEKHVTLQEQYEPIEEDSNEHHATLQKVFREDAASRFSTPLEVAKKKRDDSGSIGPSAHVAGKKSRGRSKAMSKSLVRTSTLNDGYSWRKYGQKNLDGQNPRSYYRCKSDRGCTAKRHVQLSSEDPQLWDITYDGDHSCCCSLNSNRAPGPCPWAWGSRPPPRGVLWSAAATPRAHPPSRTQRRRKSRLPTRHRRRTILTWTMPREASKHLCIGLFVFVFELLCVGHCLSATWAIWTTRIYHIRQGY
uniref:Uncharacterized protein n=1 Tax=Avena sativa TaxID=4498 RepID=A0ACD6A1L6_AVESA